MTDAEFIAWLKTPGRAHCVLVEAVASIAGIETTRYLSTTGYTTGGADSPANTHYESVIVGGGKIIERLSINGSAAMAFGDLEFDNTGGDRDSWLADIWTNRTVSMYVGDMGWPRADFRLVFSGISAGIDSRTRDVLNLKVRDKLQRLNTAVTETKLGGTSQNADRNLPILLGEAHNLEPLCIDFGDPTTGVALLSYMIHNGAIERDIEVRDSGVPITVTDTLASGTFALLNSTRGIITCSAQGAKLAGAYVNTAAKLIELLVTTYGSDPFVGDDLDTSSLATFNTANPQPLGRPIIDRENVLGIAQELAASVGAQVVMTAAGLLRLIKIDPTVAGTTDVTAQHMLERSFEIVDRLPVKAAVKIGWCKNWTVQNNLQTGIAAAHKELFKEEWLTSTDSDSAVATVYKITEEPPQENTLLLVQADAEAEATRRLNIWKVQRTIYRYTGMPELMLEELGGAQNITHARFGFSGGVDAQILSVEKDWINASCSFEVLA